MARILVVDDERDVVTLIKFLLEKEGHSVSEAHDGAEALSLLGVEPAADGASLPDIVVLDVMMPVMDGYAVAARLAEAPRTSRIPVLILTAKGAARDRSRLPANVVSFVDKPFEPRRLRQKIIDILSSKR